MLKIWVKISHQLSPGLRQIISSVGWLSLEKILRVVINLTVGIYVIRYLGADSFGQLSYCLSIVGMFEAIAKLGLDAIVLRNLVQEPEATSDILGSAFILKLVASLFTLALIAVVLPTLGSDPQIHRMTKLIAVALILRSSEVVEFWFRAQVLAKPTAIVGSLRLLISSTLKIGLIYRGFSLMAFVWLFLAEEVWQTIANVVIYWRYRSQQFPPQTPWFVWQFNFVRAKEMLGDSWPLILSGMMITIYMKIDQVMLGNMASSEVVGNYAAAVKFSEVWYFFPLAVCTSVFPSIMRAKQEGAAKYYAKLQQLYDLLAWIALVIAIIMTFASGLLVKTLLGTEYLAAGKILVLHIWAGPFVFLGVARSQWLMAENLTRLSFACTFLGTVVNLGLNFWLIPLYGGHGAAIATVLSYATVSHFACLIYPQLNHTGWMLTKALLIPIRLRQNLSYWHQLQEIFFEVKSKS
jgi:O-antigen/teichoic acid export membrane protein